MRFKMYIPYIAALFFSFVCLLCESATTVRKTMPVSTTADPAFANAGKEPGLSIWRIEDFRAVPYPKNDYGKFYSGDSYILLNTKKNKNNQFTYDIHFWLGAETTQDESGTAAILSVQLDDKLGGVPVQYREVQEHESQLFLSHFKSGVRYLPGGVKSGFTHVDRNAFVKRLYHIKGKKNIRVKEVQVSIASMNKGDCFILDAGPKIYVYVGAKSKRVERLKAISAANQIRDQDHGGSPKVVIVDEFSPEVEVEGFFQALGSGSRSSVPDDSASDDDDKFEKAEESSVSLYKVTDSSGTLKSEKVAQKPLKQEALKTDDCFILDTAGSGIFVWIGKKANNEEKKHSMQVAQDYLRTKKYPAWTQVQRVIEGGEPALFKQYFLTWKDAGELHTRLIRSTAVKERSKIEAKNEGVASDFMPDNGSGEVEVFRVENFELAPVDPANYGKFFGGDSYVVKYRHGGRCIIYIWQGKNSTVDEKASSAIHAVRLDNEMGGAAIQIRVAQDHEPKHFLNIFKGKLIVFMGGHSSGFKNLKNHDSYKAGETRLYRVRGTNSVDVRASQQVAVASSLQSDDAFIVDTDDTTYVWNGKGSEPIERELAKTFVNKLVPDAKIVVVEEGEEPAAFWKALGGKTSYADTFENELPAVSEPRLFHCHLKVSGKLLVEEINDFTQDDLDSDDVMVLDSGEEVYIWIGSGSDEVERKESLKNTQKYLKGLDNRDDDVIITVKQGHEPESFTSFFPEWDSSIWNKQLSYADLKAKFS